MIKTPIGEIEIYIDGSRIDYQEQPVQLDKWTTDLKGRYKIEIEFIPDWKEHYITCVLNSAVEIIESDIEPGERLECKSFWGKNIKLSIGIEGDAGYYNAYETEDGYDYYGGYVEYGIQYDILPTTKTQKYVFGLAWIDNPNEEREVQTWFGADPYEF